MRKLPFALTVLVAIVLAGAGLAGTTSGPVVAVAAGILVVAMVAVLGVSTERLAWLAACVLVVTITWNGIRVGGGAVGNVFMVAAFGSMVMHALLTRRPVSAPPMLLLAAGGFLLATLVTLIFPPSIRLTNLTDVQLHSLLVEPLFLGHRSDLFTLVQVELSFLVIPMVVLAAATTHRKVVRLMDLWTIGMVINAFVGLTDTLGIVHLAPTPLSSVTRSSGLTIHPNYLALGACMAIPTAMVWLNRSTRWSVAGVVSVVTLFGGIYASGSRAGAVAGLVGAVVTAVAIPRLRRGLVVAAPIIGMIAIVVLMGTGAGAHIVKQVRLGGSNSGDLSIAGSNFQRAMDAHVAIDQFQARPVEGVGFSVITDAHSIYLQLLAAGGIIALSSFLAFCGGLFAAALRGLQGPQRPEVAAAGISVVVWLANGIVDNQVADKYLYVVPGLLFAMARLASVRPPAVIVETTAFPPPPPAAPASLLHREPRVPVAS